MQFKFAISAGLAAGIVGVHHHGLRRRVTPKLYQGPCKRNMDTSCCPFELSLCRGHLKLYIYKEPYVDTNQSVFWYTMTMISHSGMNHLIVEDPREACLFLYIFSRLDCSRYCLEWHVYKLPYWNHGQNHILFDLHDDVRVFPFKAEKAMVFTSPAAVQQVLRPLCDESFPQYPRVTFPSVLSQAFDRPRRYRLTFRGSMEGNDSHRRIFLPLHNGKDVIVEDSAHGGGRYSYSDLMNTTYALILPGAKIATIRLLEAMSAGAIPVFVDIGDYIRPFSSLIRWHDCSLHIRRVGGEPLRSFKVLNHLVYGNATFRRKDVMSVLDSVSPDRLLEMQSCVRHAYQSYLSFETVGDGMLQSFLQRVERQYQHRAVKLCIAGICGTSLTENARLARQIQQNYTYSWTSSYYCPNAAPCEINISSKVTCAKCR